MKKIILILLAIIPNLCMATNQPTNKLIKKAVEKVARQGNPTVRDLVSSTLSELREMGGVTDVIIITSGNRILLIPLNNTNDENRPNENPRE